MFVEKERYRKIWKDREVDQIAKKKNRVGNAGGDSQNPDQYIFITLKILANKF